MIQPRLLRSNTTRGFAQTWRSSGSLRVEHVLLESAAAQALECLRLEDHEPELLPQRDGYQLWRHPWVPEEKCEHHLCALGRLLWGDLRVWAEKITGLTLSPMEGGVIVSDMHHKGMYIEPYDDSQPGRAIAFQLGLTPAAWPEDWGGHLEVLRGPKGPVSSVWSPGWNHLDLFDVRKPSWRRVPILREHVEGFVISGWYGAPDNI